MWTKSYSLHFEQVIHTDIKTLWEFIETPYNLDLITPDWMQFEILSNPPQQMYNGLLIRYKVGLPILGKSNWLTEIKHIEPGISFVDEQRIGPYKFWFHEHRLVAIDDNTTRMIDNLTYQPPFGPLGAVANFFKIRHMLHEVFEFRRHKMDEIFPPRLHA